MKWMTLLLTALLSFCFMAHAQKAENRKIDMTSLHYAPKDKDLFEQKAFVVTGVSSSVAGSTGVMHFMATKENEGALLAGIFFLATGMDLAGQNGKKLKDYYKQKNKTQNLKTKVRRQLKVETRLFKKYPKTILERPNSYIRVIADEALKSYEEDRFKKASLLAMKVDLVGRKLMKSKVTNITVEDFALLFENFFNQGLQYEASRQWVETLLYLYNVRVGKAKKSVVKVNENKRDHSAKMSVYVLNEMVQEAQIK